jgi:hypothetical protein
MEVDDWIRDDVPGKDFVDVGGLWGLANEKVGCAARAHAKSVTMIDIAAPDDQLWQQFRERCSVQGVTDCRCISADVHNDELLDLAGPFDVVHCSGVLYHCAEPLRMLTRLRQMCRGTLMLSSTVIPSRLEHESGTIACEPGGALFVPALREDQRLIVADYFRQVGAQTMLGLNTDVRWDERDYSLWWWLFTSEHVRALIEVAGFAVRDSCRLWHGRVAYFRAVAVTQ